MTNNTDKNTINELLSRINYHILLELIEISSISQQTYLTNLTTLGFSNEDINVIKNSKDNEKFGTMIEKLNNNTHNTYENIDDVKIYMNNNLKPQYKEILLENLRIYENDKKFHEIITK